MARRGMRSPINSVKHYIQTTNATIANNAIETIPVIEGVVAPATAATKDVKEGSVVKAIYIERWLNGASTTSGTNSQFVLTVEKKRVAETDMTFSQSQNLMAYPNKKNILYTTQGVLGSELAGANAVPIIRQWFPIPKGKQRFGLGDELVVNISAIITTRRCGMATYKEYT